VVLLAPACSSFDQFQDYEHRGRVFKELVERLAEGVESGSVRWKWDSKQEMASLGSDLSGQLQAQVPADLSHKVPEASREPAPQTVSPEVEEAHERPARPVEDDSNRGRSKGSTIEIPPHESPLVYETNAEEFPPAEDEQAEDYPEPSETGQPQELAAPEGIDDAPLPYEGRGEAESLAASGMKDTSSFPRRSSASADKGKMKPAASDPALQAKLPGMD
jgi:hypothetical protein